MSHLECWLGDRVLFPIIHLMQQALNSSRLERLAYMMLMLPDRLYRYSQLCEAYIFGEVYGNPNQNQQRSCDIREP